MDHRKRNCIFGCDINGINLHKFPNPERNPTLFSDWVNIIGGNLEKIDPMIIFNNKRVCGRHFEASQKTTGHRLVHLSRPTLNLKCMQRSMVTIIEAEHKYASSLTTPCPFPTASTSSSVSSVTAAEIKCCVPNCDNRHNDKEIKMSSNNRITFHSFPKDPKQRAAWIKSLGMSNCMPSKRTMICSEHFKDTELCDTKQGTRRIKNGAVPVVDVCKMCLCFDRKMYDIKKYHLDVMYQNVLGIMPRADDWLPQSICWECAARLSAADMFRANALLADAVLSEESFNLADILKIHRKYNSLKSSLGVQKVFSIQLQEDQEVDKQTIDIPHTDKIEIEIEMNELVKDTVKYVDEKDNEFIEEYLNLDENAVKTEVDLVHSIEVDTVPAEVDETQDDLDYEDTNFLENEDTDIKPINESIDKEIRDSNLTVLDTNEKKLKNNKENKQNDGVNISNVVAKRLKNPVVSLDRIIPTIEVKKKPVKRRAVNTDDEDAVNTIRKRKRRPPVPSAQVDENVFKIIPLKQADLIQEVLKRKDSDRYKKAPHKCDVCYMGFPTKDKLDRHAVKHTEKYGPFVCAICKIHKKMEGKLRAHVNYSHSNEYRCKLCPMVTRIRSVALGHVQFHAGKTYQCPHCPLTFKKHTSLSGHKRMKHMSDCVCEFCGHTFIGKKGVQAHKALQHKFVDENVPLDGPYCDVCDVTFLSQQAYDKHMRLSSKHITSEDDPTRISNNSTPRERRPKSVKDYSQHPIRRDTKSEPVTCEQCGMQLQSRRMYVIHFKQAHPEKARTVYPAMKTPFMCELCGKIFYCRAVLKRHMWVHTGEKQFKCDLCPKSYTLNANLVFHMLEHSATRPSYECPICGKHFTCLSNRRRHMNIHTGLKPFACDTCDKSFTTSGEQRAHVEHVHLKKPWPKRARHRGRDWKGDLPSLED